MIIISNRDWNNACLRQTVRFTIGSSDWQGDFESGFFIWDALHFNGTVMGFYYTITDGES